jgi:hypothetical protein
MRIEGPCIAKITAKHSPAVQVIALPHAWVPWMLRGACRSPSFSIKAVWPEENIGLSVCLRKQKLRLEASGIRADVGDGMRVLQRFLISRGG